MGCNQSKAVELTLDPTSAAAPRSNNAPSSTGTSAALNSTDDGRFDYERPDGMHSSADGEVQVYPQPPLSESFNYDDEPPSFVLSGNTDITLSSDSEAVRGMVASFTFSFIQVSGSNESILTPSDYAADDVESQATEDDNGSIQSERASTITVDDVQPTPVSDEASDQTSLTETDVDDISGLTEQEFSDGVEVAAETAEVDVVAAAVEVESEVEVEVE
ncbi:hypothetical protein PybrP1_010708, partial [[Pythium] brassicae (nom. inval.)]